MTPFMGKDFLLSNDTAKALVCYENLRATKQAADMAGVTTADLEKFFYGNAAEFFKFSK